jgi:hypothetical protein
MKNIKDYSKWVTKKIIDKHGSFEHRVYCNIYLTIDHKMCCSNCSLRASSGCCGEQIIEENG